MSSGGASVKSIQALGDIKAALARYSNEATQALSAALQESRNTLRRLEERESSLQSELRRKEEAVQRAFAAFAACEASGYYDSNGNLHRPDCTAQKAAIENARQELYRTQEELKKVQQWHKQVQLANDDFDKVARRLSNHLQSELPKATAQLEQKISILTGFTSESLPGGSSQATESASVSGGFMPESNGSALSAGGLGAGLTAGIGSSKNATSKGFSTVTWQDAQGRSLVMRTFPTGDQYMIQVFNKQGLGSSQALPGRGNAGQANVLLERDAYTGIVDRVRLQDIDPVPSFSQSGIEDALLDRVEEIALQWGVREIYGDTPSDPNILQQCLSRGYQLRDNGRSIFKTLHF